MSGLFHTFNVSKRGMFVQQTALHTVSHNISNANTEGYSVQRVNFKTTEPFGMPSLTTPSEPGQLGTGVKVDSITRARDVFIDTQIRKENSTLSKYSTREQFLSEIESIFMEPTDEGLANTLTKFWDAWHQLATNPESSTARTLVAENGDTLANALNNNYKQLNSMETNAGDLIRNQVFDSASILKQIQELNLQIKAVAVSGNNPNDLMDRRDLLIDQLSTRFSFDVEETDYCGIKIKSKGEPSVEIINDGTLNKGIGYVNSIKHNEDGTWDVEIQVDGEISQEKTKVLKNLNDDDIKKYFKSKNPEGDMNNIKAGELAEPGVYIHTVLYKYTSYDEDKDFQAADITPVKFENGSLNGLETISDDINKYKDQLNNIAKNLAIAINTLHSNSTKTSDSSSFFYVEAENAPNAAEVIKVNGDLLKDPSKINIGIELNGNAGNGERALLIGQLRNIRIDILQINNREDFIKNTFKDSDGNQVTDTWINDNKDADGLVKISFADDSACKMAGSPSGTTIDAYFKNSIAFLGVSNQEAKKMVTNQGSLLSQLLTRRESVSGVSLDEEITNMIQFQKSYQANAKMISVIDELLDVVVNGLIRR